MERNDSPAMSGQCLCGAVAYAVEGRVARMFFCHCSRCRKETGSAHCANIFLKDATLRWERGESELRHFALEGTRKARNFCAICGCPMPRSAGTMVVVPAGSLETPLDVEPNGHIFCDSSADWEKHLATAPRYPELPG